MVLSEVRKVATLPGDYDLTCYLHRTRAAPGSRFETGILPLDIFMKRLGERGKAFDTKPKVIPLDLEQLRTTRIMVVNAREQTMDALTPLWKITKGEIQIANADPLLS